MKKWLDKYQSKGEVNSLLTNKLATPSSDNTSVFVRQAPKKVDVIPVSSPEVQKALINYKPKPAPVYTVSNWKGGKTKDKYYDPYERIIENDPESEVNITNRMRKNFIMNKLPAALGTAIGLELIPAVSSAMNIPIVGVAGLTGHNIVNAGFATHGLNTLLNGDITSPWKEAYKTKKPLDYTKAVAENVMTGMELLPLIAPTYKGALEAGDYLTTDGKLWYDKLHLGNLKNIIPENSNIIYRGLEDESAIHDFFNTGIVRNKKSAGLPLGNRSRNYNERVFWGDEAGPFTANNQFKITAKNSPDLLKRPVTYDDIINIERKTPNGYEPYPNWQNSFNNIKKQIPTNYSPGFNVNTKPINNNELLNFKLRVERPIPKNDQIINNAFGKQHNNHENIVLEGDELKHYLSLDDKARDEFIKNHKLIPKQNGFGSKDILNKLLAPVDALYPNLTMLGDRPLGLSPLSWLPDGVYGKTLKVNAGNIRKFGNSMDDVIDSQSLRPNGWGIGSKQIKSEGNWGEPNQVNHGYNGVFAAEMNQNAVGSNINTYGIPKRNGVVNNYGRNNDPAIPLSDPGLQFHRRLPFSTKYIPIDKEALIKGKPQFSTFGGRAQALAERHLMNLGMVGGLGVIAGQPKQAIDWFQDHTVNPILHNFDKYQSEIDSIINKLNISKKQNGGSMVEGAVTNTGYKNNSKDRYNDFNIIPSNNITMKNVSHPVIGIDNIGHTKYMQPGNDYTFPGRYVTEYPVMQNGGEQEVYWRTGKPMLNDPSMDAISKVLLERNKNKNFIQRAIGEGFQGSIPTKDIPGQDPNSLDQSTLLMASGDNYVFPTIIETSPGQLSYQPDQRDEYIEAPTWDIADYFATKGYKRAANDMYKTNYKHGGVIMHIGGQSTLNPVVKKDNRNWLEYLKN